MSQVRDNGELSVILHRPGAVAFAAVGVILSVIIQIVGGYCYVTLTPHEVNLCPLAFIPGGAIDGTFLFPTYDATGAFVPLSLWHTILEWITIVVLNLIIFASIGWIIGQIVGGLNDLASTTGMD